MNAPALINIHFEHGVSNLCFLQHCGIDKLIPFMEIDDYLFDPCGYSMNGILQNVSAISLICIHAIYMHKQRIVQIGIVSNLSSGSARTPFLNQIIGVK